MTLPPETPRPATPQPATPRPAASPRSPSPRWWTFLWLTVCAHFALVYKLNTRPMLDLDRFTHGTERIPFQYRAFTAVLLRLAQSLTIPPALARHLPPVLDTPAAFALLGIAFLSMLVAVYATARALQLLAVPAARWWALLVVPMAWCHYLLAFGHPCCEPLQLPYDLPSLAFFALGLWIIVAQGLPVPRLRAQPVWLLYPLVALATTNRESTIFLIGLFALYHFGLWRQTRTPSLLPVVAHSLGLLVVFTATLLTMHRLFPHAAHQFTTLGPFENHFTDNLHFLVRPFYWLSFLSLYGFTWPYVYAHWRAVPHAGVRTALAIFPLLFAAMYVVGELSEIRIFAELIPLFTVATALLFSTPIPQSARQVSVREPKPVDR